MRNQTRDCENMCIMCLARERKKDAHGKERKQQLAIQCWLVIIFLGGFGLLLKPVFRQLFSCIFSNNWFLSTDSQHNQTFLINSIPRSMLGTDQFAQVVVVLLQRPKPKTPPTCTFSDWYNDGSCSVTCGGGYLTQKRTVKARWVKFGAQKFLGAPNNWTYKMYPYFLY